MASGYGFIKSLFHEAFEIDIKQCGLRLSATCKMKINQVAYAFFMIEFLHIKKYCCVKII